MNSKAIELNVCAKAGLLVATVSSTTRLGITTTIGHGTNHIYWNTIYIAQTKVKQHTTVQSEDHSLA